jgi:hypothetical protein
MKRQSVLAGTFLIAAVLVTGCSSSTTYTPTDAVQHGDVVVSPGGKITNLPAFTSFLGNLKHHKLGTVHITSYTTEGDPIFVDLS